MMALRNFITIMLASAIFLLTISIAHASDPSPLQDICVAINGANETVLVNGKICKNPVDVVAEDFLFQGLNVPGNTSNQLGSAVTAVNVNNLPGLNTLGTSFARLDFAPNGINPPHTHPRATEVFSLLEGTLYVGFVLSNPPPGMQNRLITRTLVAGDVFVFPQGLIHFQFNIGNTSALAFAGFSSQNPGVITIANAVFGSNPPINPNVLARAFHLSGNLVRNLQSQFWVNNNS
ncbi:hypothetical protein DM860_016027 [Cuscuta australis]|uniref:Germin-like protein n=1 Tax=Cuscuta australis TaxID=267555 RepID=A0A328DIB3_9ASTE|nr:hypothetical protein DM860_016027 [Cuscuta australis]